ncbi:unnamed protein product [Owenia fusiformis]|uniref:G-protein coupled receptors family 1 profile domain-containing protein n=1 Tax=Owenia fusiformis TaxID=6347 RepID=A0A8S4PVU1_OWEFU|nr:unnamed protein product [Owenia fusiformis]
MAIIIANLLIIIAIWKSPELNTVSDYFKGHLALTDILFGVFVLIRCILDLSGQQQSKYMCLFLLYFVLTAGGCTMTGVLLLWTEMFIAVRYTMITNTVFKHKFARKVILGVWLFWGLYTLLIFVHPNDLEVRTCNLANGLIRRYFVITSIVSFYTHVIILIALQAATLYSMVKHVNKLKQTGVVTARASNVKDMITSRFKIEPTSLSVMTRRSTTVRQNADEGPLGSAPISTRHQSSATIFTQTKPGCSSEITPVEASTDIILLKNDVLSSKNKADGSEDMSTLKVPIVSRPQTCGFKSGMATTNDRNNQRNIYRNWIKRISSLIKMITVMLISFIVCYLPLFTVTVAQFFDVNTSSSITMITAILFMTNSLTNIVIYPTLSKKYRIALKRLLTCKCGRVTQTP